MPSSVLRAATARLGPGELHVHVLETAGGELSAEAAALPHAGTTIGGGDGFRVVRLLDRLNREGAHTRRDNDELDGGTGDGGFHW